MQVVGDVMNDVGSDEVVEVWGVEDVPSYTPEQASTVTDFVYDRPVLVVGVVVGPVVVVVAVIIRIT